MDDKFEIEVHSEGVHVWAQNWKGGTGLVAEFHNGQSWEEVAQELYDLLAMAGHEVRFKGV
jgi:hypothetical protein